MADTLANQPAVLLFPRHSMDQGAITQIRQKAARAVQNMAGGANATSNILYRNLAAKDIANTTTGHLVNPATLSATAFTTLYTVTTAQNVAYALFGIVLFNAAPQMDVLQVNVGAAPVAVLPLGEIKASGSGTTPQVGFFSEPVWVPQNTILTISALGASAQTQSLELFDLLGYVGEPIGQTVSKQAIAFSQDGHPITG